MQNDDDVPPEEKEKWSLDRERDRDALNDYRQVERVIGTSEDEEGRTLYLVKCMFFSYAYSKLLTTSRERTVLRFMYLGRCFTCQ
jgi:hypothetical protein